jgi:uncharacterized membrane protein YeaQ/YmgE (transglycosylase-associated protein family)
MKITREIINFNKEILFGEIGAIVGIQAVDYIFNKMNYSTNMLSYMIVMGAILGASLFWFLMRLYDKTRGHKYTEGKIVSDISYYAPAAFILTSLFYYPTLFFATKYFLEHHRRVQFSSTTAQIIAFGLFLIGINIYRYILNKYYRKEL